MHFALLVSMFCLVQEPDSVALTVYGSNQPGAIPPELYRPSRSAGYGYEPPMQIPGFAVVRQDRTISLEEGRSTLRFTDVAAEIDPTTVSFASLTDPTGTRVLDQSFQFDLVSQQKLLERYVDREVGIDFGIGSTVQSASGTLLSAVGGLVLRDGEGRIHAVNGYQQLRLPELPGGLITRPTLVWSLATGKSGPHRTRVSYQTGGIVWWADYNVVFSEGANANKGVLDVGAWVSILNRSGASYRDAKLKLVAGDVHRAKAESEVNLRAMAAERARADVPGFAEKAFFEYHLYTLGRPATIPDRSTQQIELFPSAHGVPCDKVLVYDGAQAPPWMGEPVLDRGFGITSNKKVDVFLRWKNDASGGLGMPLPAGRVRVSKLDPADQSLELVGEDAIDHTPKDEVVLVKLGSAFDVVGERRQVDFKVDSSRRAIDETIEVKVRNHKTEPVEVLVRERLYRWSTWTIPSKTQDYEKVDARTIRFPVKVAPDGEATVTYSVHYAW